MKAMRFTLKRPSKKLIIGSLLASVFLHLFICKIPVDAFQKKESIIEVAQPSFVPIQIISVAAPRVEAAATPQVVQEESVKEAKKETEIKAPVESETAKFKFSKKEEKLEEVKTLPKPKSQVAKEQPLQIQQPIEQPAQQASFQPSPVAGHNTYNSDARLTSNDNGSADTTVIPVVKGENYTQTVAPKYPARSIQLGQEGIVLVRALVDASGSIKDVTIHSSSGYNLLDESARSAVKQWHFQPSFFSGRASTSWVEVPVKFRLQTARL
jgi:protein TonB